MTDRVVLAAIASSPLSLEKCIRMVSASGAGAIVTFSGVVRDHDAGRGVAFLEYEAHPTAAGVIATVARGVADRHPEVRIAVAHRTGRLEVGELALAAAVASAHRAAAFDACSALIDEVKRSVPIWKLQHFVDGTTEWVGSLD